MTKWNLFWDTRLVLYLKTLINIFCHKRRGGESHDHMMLKSNHVKYSSYIMVVLDAVCCLPDKT